MTRWAEDKQRAILSSDGTRVECYDLLGVTPTEYKAMVAERPFLYWGVPSDDEIVPLARTHYIVERPDEVDESSFVKSALKFGLELAAPGSGVIVELADIAANGPNLDNVAGAAISLIK